MIETRLLHYFLAIAHEQNITRAAELLHITQPTLSKQMMDLEQQLGKQLFIRGKRKLVLTEEGEFLRNRAREVMELLSNTEDVFHAAKELLSGHITIGCGETRAMDMIAEQMAVFHRQYPEVKLHTYSGDADSVLERLDKGLVDMGILLGPLRKEKYDYLNLKKQDVYGLLMREDCALAAQPAVSIEQLKKLPLIMAEQTFVGQQDIELFGTDYSAMNVVATYNLIYNAIFMVKHGIGCALCLDNLVDAKEWQLVFRPITPELSVEIYVVTKKYQTFSPAVKQFLQQIKTVLRIAERS